jgi:hypothetical protein
MSLGNMPQYDPSEDWTKIVDCKTLCLKTSLWEHHSRNKNSRRILPGTKILIGLFPEQKSNHPGTKISVGFIPEQNLNGNKIDVMILSV